MADIVIQLLPHIAAALLYGALGFHFWSTRWREQENQCVACPMQVWERVAIASALLIHAYGLYGALFTEAGMRFSFSFALSLMMWLAVLIYWLESFMARMEGMQPLVQPLAALCTALPAMHRVQQRQLPLVLLGAGLPILSGMAGESKSYAERLFSFPDIGALSREDASIALQEPALAAGVSFEDAALAEIFRLTKGYPYFLQEWAYQAWNRAETSPITLQVVQAATETVLRRLDENFFRVRFDSLTPSERNFLREMAQLGAGPHRTGDIADALNVKVTSLGPVRAKLIRKGMIYSPAHGEMAFTVPLFDEFMRRVMPEFRSRPPA